MVGHSSMYHYVNGESVCVYVQQLQKHKSRNVNIVYDLRGDDKIRRISCINNNYGNFPDYR